MESHLSDPNLSEKYPLSAQLPADRLATAQRLPVKPSPVTLHGSRIHLVPLQLELHAPALHAVSCGAPIAWDVRRVASYDADELIWRYMPYGPFASSTELAALLKALQDQPNLQTLCVIDAAARQPAGVVTLMSNAPQHLKIELGHIWFSPILQGTGAMDEAGFLLLDHCFSLGYRRVEWKCHAHNLRSRRTAQRLGFRFELVQEQHLIVKGRNRDTAWFRLLDHEWLVERQRLAARLQEPAGRAGAAGKQPAQSQSPAPAPQPAPLEPPLAPEQLARVQDLPLKPADVELQGERVRLIPARPDEHSAALHAVSSGASIDWGARRVDAYDPDTLIWRYLRYGPFAGVDAFAAYLQWLCDAPDRLPLCVLDQATGHPIGVTALTDNQPPHLSIQLGHIWYSPIAQGVGANIEAAYLMLRHCFALGYRRVEWRCHSLNTRSQRAALRIGFQHEGTQESHMIAKGRNRDTEWFRILDHEWPAVRAKLEEKLGNRT